jgi:hypothetical protein
MGVSYLEPFSIPRCFDIQELIIKPAGGFISIMQGCALTIVLNVFFRDSPNHWHTA